MRPEDAAPGKRVRVVARPVPTLPDGTAADVGTIRAVVPIHGGCLVALVGFEHPFGWDFAELELLEDVAPCSVCDRENDVRARACWWCGTRLSAASA